jgi:hypothetical protein
MALAGANGIAWTASSAGAAPSLDLLDTRIYALAGGTIEMQRNGIAERLLDLPREPSFDRDKPFREVLADAQHWTS